MEKEIFSAKKKEEEKIMRKELIICIIVIIFVIVANIFTQGYTRKTIENLVGKLQELRQKLLEDNIDRNKIEDEMKNIMSAWANYFNKLAYFIEHDELEKAETELTTLKANIEIQEYEEGVLDVDKAIFILNHIKEKFRIEIKNIF